ncbi:MAG TPA: hypothetical protein VN748_02510 [Pseudonocardiaceae bacterium]|nr:hypothetical protein [Pseudonocardiaceae bacterium]
MIVYNPPERMRVDDTSRVEVRISRELSDNLSKGLEGEGTPRIEALKVGTVMRARLEGRAFNITPIGSEVQHLPTTDYREWRWDVTATGSGNQLLSLTISVLYEDEMIEEKVFERHIDVAVNPFSIWTWLISNWVAVVASLGVAGTLYEIYRRRRSEGSRNDPDLEIPSPRLPVSPDAANAHSAKPPYRKRRRVRHSRRT